MKIGVLGANGQVGSEVCLLLSRVPGVEVVPVCRNRSGSAFLRARGLRCRHGRAADPVEARALLGDCEVVANFSLAIGRPREAREANRQLIDAAAAASLPGARIIYFSTLAVRPDFVPAGTPPMSTAYGKEKLRGEQDALSAGKRAGKATWVLRLGHVYGELQGVRDELRRLVRTGTVIVPQEGRRKSNVTHVVTIVDAILKIARGAETPGTYDLVSTPAWSWRDVLLHEAGVTGVDLTLETPSIDPFAAARPGFLAGLKVRARSAASAVLAAPRTREIGLAWIAYLPEAVNLRLQSRHFQRRAAAEIARLTERPLSHPVFTIPPFEPVALATLTPTAELLRQGLGALPATTAPFPPDLPPALAPAPASATPDG